MSEYSEDLSDMTVSERLFVTRLNDAWHDAVYRRDRKRLAEILDLVQLTEQAHLIIETELRERDRQLQWKNRPVET